MPLAANLQSAFTRVATEFRTIRTLITGSSTGDLSGLTTTAKGNLVAAINEAASKGGGATRLDELTDVLIGDGTTGTAPAAGQVLRHDGTQFVNVDGSGYFQPRDSDLDAIAALATTAFGRNLLSLADSAALRTQVGTTSETATGVVRLSTTSEANAGTDNATAITPAKLASRLGGYQPLDSDLTAIAALTTTTYGRAFLALADQAALMALIAAGTETVTGIVRYATAAETATGTATNRAVHPAGLKPLLDAKANTSSLAAVATSGRADDLTGTLPNSVLPPLAVNETFVVASQTAMLALTAQRGDVAIRTDTNRTFILAADDPTTLANWKEVTAAGQVISVAGKTGAVTLVKADVGLDQVDNTSDANKPISTATQTALNGKQNADAELSAIAGLTSAADRLPYFTGSGTASLATFTAFGRTLAAVADAAAARAAIGLDQVNNTSDVNKPISTATQTALNGKQPLDDDLTAIAGLTSAADKFPYATGAGTWALGTVTAWARGLLDDPDAATARGYLGVYSTAEIGNPETDFVAAFNTALTA